MKWILKLFENWSHKQSSDNWITDAEWARINQYPLRAKTLLYSILVVIIILIIWAANAPLDEISRGEGKVIPSQKLQTLQSLDGGLVQEILVREGQNVQKGDLLIKVNPTRFIASFSESRSQLVNLIGEVARLESLVNEVELVLPEEVKQQPDLVLRETRLYQSSRDELREQQQALTKQVEQRQQEYNEASAAVLQHEQTLKLNKHELEVTKPLLKSGAVSEIDILRLEREVVRVQGELNRAKATQARSLSAIDEARSKQREIRLSMINRWRNQLIESSSKLDALIKAEQGLEDKVLLTDIRSPIHGTIQRLHINTVGGVISPGREVVDIVPLDDKLIVEARIPPKDIAFIKLGQRAMIRFSAYDFTIYGGVEAEVSHISADTITNEKDETYYLVQLTTNYSTLHKDLLIIPGMTTQVDIITGERTVLMYLLKPLLRARTTALTER